MDNFRIHKYEGIFYILTLSKYEENEWDVVGRGSSLEDALRGSLSMYVGICTDLQKTLEETLKIFSDRLLVDGQYLKEEFQKRPIETTVSEEENNPFSFCSFVEEEGVFIPMNSYCILRHWV